MSVGGKAGTNAWQKERGHCCLLRLGWGTLITAGIIDVHWFLTSTHCVSHSTVSLCKNYSAHVRQEITLQSSKGVELGAARKVPAPRLHQDTAWILGMPGFFFFKTGKVLQNLRLLEVTIKEELCSFLKKLKVSSYKYGSC